MKDSQIVTLMATGGVWMLCEYIGSATPSRKTGTSKYGDKKPYDFGTTRHFLNAYSHDGSTFTREVEENMDVKAGAIEPSVFTGAKPMQKFLVQCALRATRAGETLTVRYRVLHVHKVEVAS